MPTCPTCGVDLIDGRHPWNKECGENNPLLAKTGDSAILGESLLGKMEYTEDLGIAKKAHRLHGRREVQGLKISIENKKGSTRSWYDPHNDEKGSTTMQHDYGYILGTEATDGEKVDVYVGPDENAGSVYVVHQMKAPDFTAYDEDKCMVGFSSAAEAKKAYLAHYNKPGFFGSMTTMSMADFKKKLSTRKGQIIKDATDGIPTLDLKYGDK